MFSQQLQGAEFNGFLEKFFKGKESSTISIEDLASICKKMTKEQFAQFLNHAMDITIRDDIMNYLINTAGTISVKYINITLINAVKKNNETWVIALMKHKAINSQYKDESGKKPADYAKEHTRIKKILSTPYRDMIHLIEDSKSEPTTELLENTFAKTIAVGIDQTATGKENLPAMYLAIKKIFPNVVKFLYEKGWDINQPQNVTTMYMSSTYNRTPLLYLLSLGNLRDYHKMLQVLISDCKANTNVRFSKEVMYSTFHGYPQSSYSSDGYFYPHDYFRGSNSNEIVNLLKPKEIPYYAVDESGKKNQKNPLPRVELAVKNFPDFLTYKDNINGYNAFLRAVYYGFKDVAEYLLTLNHDFFTTKSADGKSALTIAAKCGKADIVKWLIEEGADINIVDSEGSTAVDYANDECSDIIKNTTKKIVVLPPINPAMLGIESVTPSAPPSEILFDDSIPMVLLPLVSESKKSDDSMVTPSVLSKTEDTPSTVAPGKTKEPLRERDIFLDFKETQLAPQSFAGLLVDLYARSLYQHIQLIEKPEDPLNRELLLHFKKLPPNNSDVFKTIKRSLDLFEKEDVRGLLALHSSKDTTFKDTTFSITKIYLLKLATGKNPNPIACSYFKELALEKSCQAEDEGNLEKKEGFLKIARMNHRKANSLFKKIQSKPSQSKGPDSTLNIEPYII